MKQLVILISIVLTFFFLFILLGIIKLEWKTDSKELTIGDTDYHKITELRKLNFHYTEDGESRVYSEIYTTLQLEKLLDLYIDVRNETTTFNLGWHNMLDSISVGQLSISSYCHFHLGDGNKEWIEDDRTLSWEWKSETVWRKENL